MPETVCGFIDGPAGSGAQLLVFYGPTLDVDIGFDPGFKIGIGVTPQPGIKGVKALVDTGATASCIDAMLASALNLPIVDRKPIAGVGGVHEVNMHLAQVHIPSLNFTLYGEFAAVNLTEGGQPQHAIIGRTFLQHYMMIYEGKTGSVILRHTP